MSTKPVTDEAAIVASVEAAPVAVEHDRAVTPVGAGRIRFKGHTAKDGYPYRLYEGRVQALVSGEWVEAPEAERIG